MNSATQFELRDIRENQDRLHRLVENLDRRIERVAKDLLAPSPEPIAPALPPPLPPLPAKLETPVESPPPRVEKKASPSPHVPLLPLPSAPPPRVDEPLELRVGTFWLARLGIVVLLTGLVFLGNYAYHLIVPVLGPWGKVSFLLMTGLGLAGAGYWMERGKESLQNFGRVLLGGGAAAVYYTIYAAHYVRGLRVIESPLVGGCLLLALAGGIAWVAERKRSESVATIAVLLSYYTAVINPIAGFTLFSSLLLTALAVYFLFRNQWTRLSVLSLFATYGCYQFWWHYRLAQPKLLDGWGFGVGFLASYWLLFTAAVLLDKSPPTSPGRRVVFLTFNNFAFFNLSAEYFACYWRDGFWMFSLGFGGVLLGFAALAAARRPEERSVDGAYFAQGLIAIAAGVAAKFSGPQFAVIYALASAALITGVRRRQGLLCEIAAGLCALGALVLALASIRSGGSPVWTAGTPVAAVLIFNAWWIKYRRGELREALISGHALGFSWLGLILVGAVVWQAAPDPWKPAAFALLSVLALAAFRVRLAEVGVSAQGFILLAGLLDFGQSMNHAIDPWWSKACVPATALLLLHWWQSRREDSWKEAANAVQLLLALVVVGLGADWLRQMFHWNAWLVAISLAAVGTVAYGLATRAWAVALIGQSFSVIAIGSFLFQLAADTPAATAALMPAAAMMSVSVLLSRWGSKRWPAPPAATYAQIAGGYRLAAAILFAIWAFNYVPSEWRVAYFATVGGIQLVIGSVQRSHSRIVSGTLYAAAGVVLYWSRPFQPMLWLDLFALISIPFCLRMSTRLTGESPVPKVIHNLLITLVLVSVWQWITRWVLGQGASGHLTTAWTVLALIVFGGGLALRERVYRLGGFVILGLALARLFAFDVWRFDSLYRIISFLFLGVALLALSFVYHRFSETLRKIL